MIFLENRADRKPWRKVIVAATKTSGIPKMKIKDENTIEMKKNGKSGMIRARRRSSIGKEFGKV
jgi:hypothetical protein